MKRTSTFVLLLLWSILSFGQVPQGVSYQAVATNTDGIELRNQPINVKATIRSGSLNGPQEWIETHQIETDEFGLFVIVIGMGVPETGGNQQFFSDIKWGQDIYFLQMEIDPTGGTNFEFLGANQILSVPYALYSEYTDTAAVAMSVAGDNDLDATNEIQSLTFDENTQMLSIENGGQVDLSSLATANSDEQNLTLTGTNLAIENGNTIDLAVLQDGNEDADADPNNEIQELTVNGTNISLSGSTTNIDLNNIPININDADADPMNEIQSLTFDENSQMLSIENGGEVDLSSLTTANSDEQNLTLTGTNLAIENGNTIDLAVLQDGNEDADADPNNEIQSLTFDENSQMLSIENGGEVDLSSLATANSDEQNLALTGTILGIENGNTIDLAVLQDGNEDADADPNNEIQEITVNGTNIGLSGTNTNIDLNTIPINTDDADADPMNEMQDLDFDPNTNELSISGGNTITISSNSADADADPNNEIQNLTLNGSMLGIENGNAIDLSILQDGVEDADANPNNELQNLNFNGTLLSIDNGNSVNLSTLQDGVNDADADPTNEIQDLAVNGSSISLSNSTTNIDLDNISFNKDDADADPTNEIQELTVSGTNISLSGSSTNIDLNNIPINTNDADADPNNELQNLTTNGTSISMTGSNVNLDLNTIPFDKNDADADPTNEIQTLTYDEGTITLSGSNAINLSDFNFGAPTAEGNFPAGIFGNPVLLQMGQYTVPAGKTLYVLGGPATMKVQTNTGMRTHSLAPFMPIFQEGEVIEDCMCVGSLVDVSPDLTPVKIDFVETPVYTVPAGKMFFMKSGIVHDDKGTMNVNNMEMEFLRPNFLSWSKYLYFDEGTELRNPILAGATGLTLLFTGYLVDK